jgi:hypothetical protein
MRLPRSRAGREERDAVAQLRRRLRFEGLERQFRDHPSDGHTPLLRQMPGDLNEVFIEIQCRARNRILAPNINKRDA